MPSEQRAVGVVGAGYVGLTTAACLARLGHDVICADIDESKVDKLGRAEVPIAEPGLPALVREGLDSSRLRFTTELGALARCDVVLLCLPTPMSEQGDADLGAVDAALGELAPVLARGCVLATKSTVPVGTTLRLRQRLSGNWGRADVRVVSNPEFLREGHAVTDFLHPDRIVLGTDDDAAGEAVAALYENLDAPVVRTGFASAELAKYASNGFLALKLSYVNELAELCERLGADIGDVGRVMGMDGRIGPAFLAPGPGWGGSCLPKDTEALVRTSGTAGLDFRLLREATLTNLRQQDRVLAKVRRAVGGRLAGARIGVLGLTFKAGTDDLRHSPALAVADRLAREGAILTAYDPKVEPPGPAGLDAQVVDDPCLVAKDAEVILVLTEWPEFRQLDWPRLATLSTHATVVDTRNLLDADALARAGLRHTGTGAG
ncbi:UDP-glucose dehydrogenase family protein [Amycolatopsis pigmentata]|uniref:UDP-glucose 6-dehydrogenase n=1 Tax=Amycolatopsis pigmentata TaxID=450801 RepID=A0ABW5FXY2_9PSEU